MTGTKNQDPWLYRIFGYATGRQTGFFRLNTAPLQKLNRLYVSPRLMRFLNTTIRSKEALPIYRLPQITEFMAYSVDVAKLAGNAADPDQNTNNIQNLSLCGSTLDGPELSIMFQTYPKPRQITLDIPGEYYGETRFPNPPNGADFMASL
ncbi:hypothetical protein BDW62DRAFT_162618 [Aspergillus aurantiobrunneus]